MKYKRINVTIPHEIYHEWIQKFDKGEKDFNSFKYFITIDGLNFGILLTSSLSYSYPLLLLRVYNTIRNNDFSGTGDTKLHSDGFKKVYDLISVNTFVYNRIAYVLTFNFENLQANKYLNCIKKFGTNPVLLNPYVYSADITNYQDILDICSCFLQIKFNKEYTSPKKTKESFESKMDVLNLFLNKLSYYGFEITDCNTISNEEYLEKIASMPNKTKKEIIQTKIEYLNYKLKNKDILPEITRKDIINKSKVLYNKYLSL